MNVSGVSTVFDMIENQKGVLGVHKAKQQYTHVRAHPIHYFAFRF